MNTFKVLISVILASMFFFYSCKKEENTIGKIQFGCDIPLLKSTGTSTPVTKAVISISDNAGKTIYDNFSIEILNMNGHYISNPISLKTGDYKLCSFLLADKDNNVLYATPIRGSAKEHLVSNPLSIDFQVKKDEVLKLTPEVVSAIESKPEDFGYATFSFEIAKTFDFLLSVMIYNETIKNYELTSASLKIYAGGSELVSRDVTNITNQISLPDRYSDFELRISKSGYKEYIKKFSGSELKKYFASSDSGPLKVILEKGCSLPAGAVAFYKFNGNANDESGNNNHGTVLGPVLTNDRSGNANKAYYFDGVDDYIKLPVLTKLNNVSQITLSFWMNTDFSFGDKYSVVFGHWSTTAGAGSGNIGMEVFLATPETQFAGGVCSSMISGESDWSATGILSSNVWTNVVVVYDGTKTNTLERNSIYINGIFKGYFGNANIPAVSGSAADMTIIGAQVFKTIFRFYKGSLDDIGVWNRALSANEITTLAICN